VVVTNHDPEALASRQEGNRADAYASPTITLIQSIRVEFAHLLDSSMQSFPCQKIAESTLSLESSAGRLRLHHNFY